MDLGPRSEPAEAVRVAISSLQAHIAVDAAALADLVARALRKCLFRTVDRAQMAAGAEV